MTAPWLDDGDVQLYHGAAFDVLADPDIIPSRSVQTVVTSPPYWGLRDYAVEGQLGLESTPDEYVQRIVAIFHLIRGVLRDDGTVWLNLGDSYNAYNGGAGPGSMLSQTASAQRPRLESGYGLRFKGLKPKDLVGIPWRVAFALQADGWYLRSDIIWSKPNPMPESVSDRPTKAHEYLFLLTKQPRYYFDADAIREPHSRDWASETVGQPYMEPWQGRNDGGKRQGNHQDPAGRNRRSVWTIATQPFPEAHFATYPEALVRPCILAGTSERGECSECGAPWVRQAERTEGTSDGRARPSPGGRVEHRLTSTKTRPPGAMTVGFHTTGWRPSCTCERSRPRSWKGVKSCPGCGKETLWVTHSCPAAPTQPQTVLDPFIGSGTTALVARKHGRRCIGIDLSAEYLEIAARRLAQQSLLAEEPA